MGRPSSPPRHWGPVGGAAVGAGAGALLGPAWGRVLPGFLAAVDGEVHERVAVVHGLDAAAGGPVGLEDAVAVAQVADQVEQALLAVTEERVEESCAEYQGMSQPMKSR